MIRRLCTLLALALLCQVARADTTIRLLQSFAGNVNFVGTQKTLRYMGNNNLCEIYGPGADRTATISGIPANATIVSAHLYWAGSGASADYSVVFEGATVAAAADRRYYSATIGSDFNYFSGAADVTTQVKNKGNGTYHFSGLTISNGSPYCTVEGVMGGFALLVIYSESSQPYRVLNLYEGFQFMRYTGIRLNLSNFKIPNPMGTATGRVSHITWEGDSTLQQEGENLSFNGTAMTDSANPSGNQFNSRSNINGDAASYGIDFDAYTIGSPVIASGQTSAYTTYESGQDLVLLSAEVIAIPNVPAADLSVAITRKSELSLGQNVDYEVIVKNNGPSTEDSPTVITDVLPAGLTYVSRAGSGWSCSASGQTVTCSNSRQMAPGVSLPALTITARVTATGSITNQVSVAGKLFDHISGNNAAKDTGTAKDDARTYVFTNKECTSGVAFDVGNQCSPVLDPVAAGADRAIYITAVVQGVPTAVATATTLKMKFGLQCINPVAHASVQATYFGLTLPVCGDKASDPGAWGADRWSAEKTFVLPADKASVAATFRYRDVGKVQLYMLITSSANAIVDGLPFIVYPFELRLTQPLAAGALIKAGTDFTLTAQALTDPATGAQVKTPNFGKESTDPSEPGRQGFGVPTVSNTVTSMIDPPALSGAFVDASGGESSHDFSWSEVGTIRVTPAFEKGIQTYLNNGQATLLTGLAMNRFIPDHFQTAVTAPLACPAKLACPALSGAAFSPQQFGVTVTAKSASGTPTFNYRGTFARAAALTAWNAPGGTTQNPAGGTLSAPAIPAAAFDAGVATTTASYSLPVRYIHTSPAAAWTSPTPITMRAAESAGGDGVTSLVAGAEEGPVTIVNGRLLVPNGFGSERLGLPLQFATQYWNGKFWATMDTDSSSIVDPVRAAFTTLSGTASPSLQPTAARAVMAGVAAFTVQLSQMVPGSYHLVLNNPLYPWLPSTKGRLKFGTRKTPLIYLRESY